MVLFVRLEVRYFFFGENYDYEVWMHTPLRAFFGFYSFLSERKIQRWEGEFWINSKYEPQNKT